MGELPTESRNIGAEHARGRAVNIRRPHAYPEERREEILRAYEERSSLRGLERTFGVSRTSVISWIKKGLRAASIERNADLS